MNSATHTSIVLQHDTVRRGRRVILHAARVDVPASGVVGLVGINGAGKTTLMLALANLLAPGLFLHAARLMRRPGTASPSRSGGGRTVAFAPQRPAFPEWLDAYETVRMFGYDYDHVVAAFPALLLDELRRIRGQALSVGQAQSLAVALALQADAGLTLLDEPFAPLDFRRRVALSHVLRGRRGAGGNGRVTIVSSQSAAELLDFCDWLLVLKDGRYAYSGPVAELLDRGSRGDPRDILEQKIMAML